MPWKTTPNKPLQRMNACASRSIMGCAATARATPAPPRGRGTVATAVWRSLLNGKSLGSREPCSVARQKRCTGRTTGVFDKTWGHVDDE
jgi:hypothetical protein